MWELRLFLSWLTVDREPGLSSGVQKMTVRDFGYQVGQLAPEWRNISDSQAVVKEAANGFYIEITRSGSDEKVYVKVMQNGSVSEVTNSYPF